MYTKKLNSVALALAIILTLQSCIYRIALKQAGILDKENSIIKISNQQKEICFLPMHHIGKKEFYDDTKRQLDSLINLGYYVFFEGLNNKTIDEKIKDTLLRKMRSVTGVDLVNLVKKGGYIDSATGLTIFPNKGLNKIIKKENLVSQPSNLKKPKIEMATGMGVDEDLSNLIKGFEAKYGIIQLTDKDWNTNLGEPFKIKNGNSKSKKEYIKQYLRNKYLAQQIVSSTHNKIVLVYGKNHKKGLLEELQKIDATYNIVQ
ncbi:MAG: hypothetical protein HOO89_13010 [Ferruginibacter sp.]|nr:hypothetical protein [Ferruginibacter sp.]